MLVYIQTKTLNLYEKTESNTTKCIDYITITIPSKEKHQFCFLLFIRILYIQTKSY